MAFYKLLKGGCGTALGILAIHRYKTLSSPVQASDVKRPAAFDCCEAELKEFRDCGWDDNWDKQQSQTTRSQRHIILIRHGHFDSSSDDRDKRILTNLGREQAALVAKRLQELGCPFEKIIHSTMPRARETAEIISSHFPDVKMCASNLFEEGAPLPPEPAVTGFMDDQVRQFSDGPRIEAAFRQLLHRSSANQQKDSFEIVVCHSNVIRYFVCRALQFPPEGFLRLSPAHCSITWITVTSDGRVVMQSFGESSFMPPGKITAYSEGKC